MTIQIDPVEGARRIEKAVVAAYQDPEKIDKITDEEWEEAVNVAQNNENLSVHYKRNIQSFYTPFRKKVFAIFYKNFDIMVELNSSNLKELYKIFFHYVLELMPSRFIYVTGKIKAIKSEFEWEKNESKNLEQLLTITEEEDKKIDKTAPTGYAINATIRDALVRQKDKKAEERTYTPEEAQNIIQSIYDAVDLQKKTAGVIKKLYGIMIPEIMDICLFNTSHLTEKEITSIRGRFIQDIYDFLSKIVNQTNEFIEKYMIATNKIPD